MNARHGYQRRHQATAATADGEGVGADAERWRGQLRVGPGDRVEPNPRHRIAADRDVADPEILESVGEALDRVARAELGYQGIEAEQLRVVGERVLDEDLRQTLTHQGLEVLDDFAQAGRARIALIADQAAFKDRVRPHAEGVGVATGIDDGVLVGAGDRQRAADGQLTLMKDA